MYYVCGIYLLDSALWLPVGPEYRIRLTSAEVNRIDEKKLF